MSARWRWSALVVAAACVHAICVIGVLWGPRATLRAVGDARPLVPNYAVSAAAAAGRGALAPGARQEQEQEQERFKDTDTLLRRACSCGMVATVDDRLGTLRYDWLMR